KICGDPWYGLSTRFNLSGNGRAHSKVRRVRPGSRSKDHRVAGRIFFFTLNCSPETVHVTEQLRGAEVTIVKTFFDRKNIVVGAGMIIVRAMYRRRITVPARPITVIYKQVIPAVNIRAHTIDAPVATCIRTVEVDRVVV